LLSLTMAAPQVVPGAAFDALVELVQGLQLPPVEAFHVAEAAVPALEKIAHNYAYAHKKVLDCIASMRRLVLFGFRLFLCPFPSSPAIVSRRQLARSSDVS